MSTTGATIAWIAVTVIGFISPTYENSAGQNLLVSVSPAAGTQSRSVVPPPAASAPLKAL